MDRTPDRRRFPVAGLWAALAGLLTGRRAAAAPRLTVGAAATPAGGWAVHDAVHRPINHDVNVHLLAVVRGAGRYLVLDPDGRWYNYQGGLGRDCRGAEVPPAEAGRIVAHHNLANLAIPMVSPQAEMRQGQWACSVPLDRPALTLGATVSNYTFVVLDNTQKMAG